MAQSSNYSTIARPYAQAVFEVASESGRLDAWSELLQGLAALVEDETGLSLIQHPGVPPEDLAEALCSTLKGLDDDGRNFVHLLAVRRRLVAAREMAREFESLRDAAEGRIKVTVRSAHALKAKDVDGIKAKLAERLGRSIELDVVDDDSLIGGVVLQAGDLVIDGSVKGQLDRLAAAMTH